MELKCISNDMRNGNFTINNIYRTINRGKDLECGFGKIQFDIKNIDKLCIGDEIEYAFCKFEFIKQ